MGIGTAWGGRLTCNEKFRSVRIRLSPPLFVKGEVSPERLWQGLQNLFRWVRLPSSPPMKENDMDVDKLLKRKQELFGPIEMQIYMTDDRNDLLLLASSMCQASFRIFLQEFTEEETKALVESLFSISSSTGREQRSSKP